MKQKRESALKQDKFELVANFEPRGDQPQAIDTLDSNLKAQERFQTLQGVTGSGKTFTIANLIARNNRPTLVIAPNKTLAAQLFAEFKEFFPKDRVRYFVSYYDYYQPEAYVPSTDTYIEKDASINDEIDKMRHSATRAILEGRNTIIVASVSCIYGLGAPDEYFKMMLFLEEHQAIEREEIIRRLVALQYNRADVEFKRGSFRVRGETIDIFPADEDAKAIRLLLFSNEIEEIREVDSITGSTIRRLDKCAIYPVSHFVTSKEAVSVAINTIKQELEQQLKVLSNRGKPLEAQRLEQRTLYDLELMSEIGFCPGIENYSRHLTQRAPGSAPTTLIDYFPKDFLLVIDESHVTISQLGGMYRGDRSRKETLVDYGFRLPSALDNRPLNFDEFWERVGQTIFVSATPGDFELEKSGTKLVEQINRPTGLLDPEVSIRPALNQVDDLINEINKTVAAKERVLVLTLTKRMAEDLADYLRELNVRSKYLHSEIHTLERVEILQGLRRGDFDCLIGINLLREGLDLVEVSLVAILDADKEGFLRSTRSLIQIMGRAARNINGRVILYADRITDSINRAVAETDRRRKIQAQFNAKHGIVPTSAKSGGAQSGLGNIHETIEFSLPGILKESAIKLPTDNKAQKRLLQSLRAQMIDAAAKKEFEVAANLRDTIIAIEKELLKY